MRSVPKGSYRRLSGIKPLWHAWLDCRRGKRRQPAIAAFDLNADRHLFRLARELRDGRYRPSPYRLRLVRDPKTRLIAAPAIRDRVLQQALLSEIAPTYERGFIDQHYAVGHGRGPHRAALRLLGWMRRWPFRITLDVHQYFASVEIERLLALFDHRLRDADTLALIGDLLAAGRTVYQTPLARALIGPVPPGRGLPLGGFLSHWSGALYLDGLDHFVKRELKIGPYLRYMDDFVLLGERREELAAAREAIGLWLAAERGLRLKHPDAPVLPNSQPASFLGFRISRAGLLPGPKMKRRLRTRLHDAQALGPARLARGLAAYRGVLAPFDHSAVGTPGEGSAGLGAQRGAAPSIDDQPVAK